VKSAFKKKVVRMHPVRKAYAMRSDALLLFQLYWCVKTHQVGAVDRVLEVRIAQILGQTGACGGVDHLLANGGDIGDKAEEEPLGSLVKADQKVGGLLLGQVVMDSSVIY